MAPAAKRSPVIPHISGRSEGGGNVVRALQTRVRVTTSLLPLPGLPLPRLALLATILTLGVPAAGCAAQDGDDAAQQDDDLVPDEADAEPVGTAGEAIQRSAFDVPSLTAAQREAVLAKYAFVDPSKAIAARLRESALVYFDVNKAHLDNTNFLAVVDFARPSKDKRFFVVDMRSGAVTGYVTAHGSGSDRDNDGMADTFSNKKNSNASSVGFYATGEIYGGKWGRSLRLDGLSETNSNVRARDVVVHGATYVREGRAKQGRSWGCFALPLGMKDAVISKLAGGALIYADR
jgi:hypothetical protein